MKIMSVFALLVLGFSILSGGQEAKANEISDFSSPQVISTNPLNLTTTNDVISPLAADYLGITKFTLWIDGSTTVKCDFGAAGGGAGKTFTIDWGDGTKSTKTISGSNGGSVSGSLKHTYPNFNARTVKLTVTSAGFTATDKKWLFH